MNSEKETRPLPLNTVENKKFLLEQKNKIIDDYVFITTSDLHGKIVDISQAYLDFTGYTKDEVIGKNHSLFRNHSMSKDIIENLWNRLKNDKTWIGELKNNKSTGEEYWISAVIKPLYDINNIKIGYTAIKEDITTKKLLEELSTKDQLTLLHNRRHFEYFTKKELNKSKSKKKNIALILLEIDYYSEYKNRYGDIKAQTTLVDDLSNLKEEAMLILLHINHINSLKELYGFDFVSSVIQKKADELREVLEDNETTLYNLNLQEFAILVTDKKLFEKYFLLLKHSILLSDTSDEDSTSHYLVTNFTAGVSYGVKQIFNKADLVLQEAIASKLSFKTYKTDQSARQLQVDYIKNRLDKFGGDGITFEILESEDILDYSVIEKFVLMVKEYGIDYIQGYYYGEPQPPEYYGLVKS